MFELAKKILLPFALVVFIVAIFLDQNNNPVPLKLILGPPVHLSLSLIIAISMTVGALVAIALFLIIKALTQKGNNNEISMQNAEGQQIDR